MEILVEFLLRLACGFSFCLALSSPRDIETDFFRFQAWVVMGIAAVAAALVTMGMGIPAALEAAQRPTIVGLTWGACGAAYLTSIVWLYRKVWLGRAMLVCQGGLAMAASAAMLPGGEGTLSESASVATMGISPWEMPALGIWAADFLTGAMLLGSTTAAMLLGHWYLNNPGMKLAPLERLVAVMGISVLARAGLCGIGLAVTAGDLGQTEIVLVVLRWLWGLIGLFVLTWMTWQTVKIPNTQSATGILYVGMIGAFLGELASQLLSQSSQLPV